MRYEEKGLVLRETPVSDNDRYLDILTAEHGRISVYGRGIRSFRSRSIEAAQPLCYSCFTLERQRADFVVLIESQKLESFNDSRLGLDINSLCMYVCEVVRELSLPDTECGALLRLTLNTLHAVCNSLYDRTLIKAAFELRAMSEEGFMPDLSVCGRCGGEPRGSAFLDVMNGSLICGSCAKKGVPDNTEQTGAATVLTPLSAPALEAMRYILQAPLNRIFAFTVSPAALAELSCACETYLLNHMERSFPTLDFYRLVIRMPEIKETDKETDKETNKDTNKETKDGTV